jgi:Major capsid protein N-terminus/Large eukaryotic DNA virus major capsid protein
MPGGVMQLVSLGTQDQYLTGSPSFSYFKNVMRTHTNFAMESVMQTFANKPVLDVNGATFTCRVQRIADLLQDIYLCFTLPDIYSNDTYRFRWIKNIAQVMISQCSVRLDSQLIDQSYGDWMEIWNELALDTGKRTAFDRMVGNVEDFIAPRMLDPQVVIINNRMTYVTYPAAKPGQPSIKSRQFYIPLPFWFCRNPALALPLVAIQYNILEITIEMRGINELYQVYDISTDEYISPGLYTSRYGSAPVSFDNFTRYGGGGPGFVDLNAYLECNFIFLDNAERQTLATMPLDYLVDRVYRIEKGGLKENNTVDLILNNPVKELVWVLRRSDARDYNEWTNYTKRIPEESNAPIMASARLLWNGLERLQEKPQAFFNMLQPYQYHTNTPRDGIYVYSFSIFPEKHIASGAFNASMINSVQLYLTMNYEASVDPEYEVIVYSRYHNIFRVINGEGRMVFV